jgi:type I restriction enzyme S subunit
MMKEYRFDQIAIVSTEKKKPTEEDRANYVGLEHLSPDTFDVTEYGSEVAPKGEKLVMRKGDVLFGKRRAYQRKVGIAPCDGIFSAHGMVLRPNEDVVDSRFFPFFIKSDCFLDEAIRISVGSLSPTVNWRDLRELRFNLPSLERQHELAELLWAGEELKSTYRQLLFACDEQVKSRFVEMFGDPIENEKHWQETTLLDSLETGRSVSYGIVQLGDEYEGPDGVPVFRPTDIAGGRRPLRSELKVTSPDIAARYKRTLLSGKELLVTVRGSIGETLQVDDEFVGCNVGRNIVPLVTDESIVRQKFLEYLLHQDAVVKWLDSITKGIALQGLNMGEFKKMRVIMPPLSNQDEFVAFARQVDKSEYLRPNCAVGFTMPRKSGLDRHRSYGSYLFGRQCL